jgi:hydrogenase maturation factor
MRLGVPGQVVEVHGDDAVVDFWGRRKRVLV